MWKWPRYYGIYCLTLVTSIIVTIGSSIWKKKKKKQNRIQRTADSGRSNNFKKPSGFMQGLAKTWQFFGYLIFIKNWELRLYIITRYLTLVTSIIVFYFLVHQGFYFILFYSPTPPLLGCSWSVSLAIFGYKILWKKKGLSILHIFSHIAMKPNRETWKFIYLLILEARNFLK